MYCINFKLIEERKQKLDIHLKTKVKEGDVSIYEYIKAY